MTAMLSSLNEVALTVIAISISGALGLLFGRIHVRGVGLGIGGVLFAGIALGDISSRLGLHYSAEMMEFVREFGLILFVFTIGIQVGPGFFASLRKSGMQLNIAAASIVCLGVLVTVAIHYAFGVPVPALVGLMSGAVTNTPGLGAATQALTDMGAGPGAVAQPSLGYAVAYPFGILGILLTMLLVRFVTRVDVDAEAAAYDAERRKGASALPSINVVIRNPNLDGLELRAVPGLYDQGVVASRMKSGGELILPRRETRVRVGDMLHLVGTPERLEAMRLILGEETDAELTTKGTQMAWARVVVTDRKVVGHRLRSLGLEEAHGVTVSRILRAGLELPVQADTTLEFGDIVTVVGSKETVQDVRGVLGDQSKRLDEVDFPGLFVGLALGVLLGSIPLAVPGLPAPLKLGLAGGPLVVAILLGRLGHWGPFMWFMPPVANHAMREFGIILFLAVVGLKAGDQFLDTLLNGDGVAWVGYGVLITLIPLVVVGFVARLVFNFNYLTLCGVLSGSMTDPPALAFANAQSSSPASSIAYATVYPLVMGLRIFAPQLIVLLLL
ncbi:putative transporter [Tropicimonas sediminicola]|uniref:Putative transport protein n=1 Tax=Tropicimonas sediminicola TaxID=1031541 RepID=A0A239M4Q2_9RHOB|nr:putative transporter [Tropicimonas sediminicola]SNT37666.1 putative transport protein [Tropicimonas sediminicola]